MAERKKIGTARQRISSRELLRQVRYVIERPYRVEMSANQHDFGGPLELTGAQIEEQDRERIGEIGRLVCKQAKP